MSNYFEMRDLVLNDLVKLEKNALFPLDNLINKPMIFEKSFGDEDGLIGSILVNRTVELAAIFGDRSKRDKIKVMKRLFNILYHELYPKGYRDLHAFVDDPNFADILVKHFSFEPVVGKALVRRY